MNGWRLTGWLSLLLVAMAAAFLALQPDVEGLRLVIRATARTSLVLFALAFTPQRSSQLAPGEMTRWQRRNRRYLGVSFAVSHGHPSRRPGRAGADRQRAVLDAHDPANIVLAGTAYLFIAAMTATSFDRTRGLARASTNGGCCTWSAAGTSG